MSHNEPLLDDEFDAIIRMDLPPQRAQRPYSRIPPPTNSRDRRNPAKPRKTPEEEEEEAKAKQEENEAEAKLVHQQVSELLKMGFPVKLITKLYEYLLISSPSDAVDMLIKSEVGWTHAFLPSSAGRNPMCAVCQEAFSEHLEGKLGDQVRVHQEARPARSREVMEIVEELLEAENDTEESAVQCKICLEKVGRRKQYKVPCGHVFCKGCIRDYLTINIENSEISMLRCPEDKCEWRFTKAQIKTVCTRAVYEKYLKFKENLEVATSKKIKWCPAPDCGRFVENKQGKALVKCQCGFEMCFKCGEGWHPGISCKKNQEKLYHSWASGKKIQRCPKCNIRIEKDEGCNHMTCSFCKYQWCWICGMKYSSSHYKSVVFGCPLLQYTCSDWSLLTIFFLQLGLFIFWPIICLIICFFEVSRMACDCYDSCYNLRPILLIIAILCIVVVSPIMAAIIFLPSYLYRLYTLFYVFVRACRSS